MDEQGSDSRCLVVGDDTYLRNDYYASQLHMQAGLEPYTNASSVLNNVVFGSSLHNPLRQMADWVGYALRAWAEGRPNASSQIAGLLPHFRGYPDEMLGRGIVAIPSKSSFPVLPLGSLESNSSAG